MDKIICLVGASGSGKTTLAKRLGKLGYNIIHSYTTRKPRYEGEWGHIFIDHWLPVYSDNVFIGVENPNYDNQYIDIDDMIAYFNNYNKGEHYFATRRQYRGKGTSIYVVDPSGVEEVKENVKDAEVITIYLMADNEVRKSRMIKDGRTEEDILDRLYKDLDIFATCKCDYVVDCNRHIDSIIYHLDKLGVL